MTNCATISVSQRAARHAHSNSRHYAAASYILRAAGMTINNPGQAHYLDFACLHLVQLPYESHCIVTFNRPYRLPSAVPYAVVHAGPGGPADRAWLGLASGRRWANATRQTNFKLSR